MRVGVINFKYLADLCRTPEYPAKFTMHSWDPSPSKTAEPPWVILASPGVQSVPRAHGMDAVLAVCCC